MSGDKADKDVLALAAQICSAYVSKHDVPRDELPALIAEVYAGLADASKNAPSRAKTTQEPAVPIDQSVTDDAIICLEDGRAFKSLKRHLRTQYDLTPQAYREKWGLPGDYPMVAPSYARQRSKLAKKMGLGKSS